MTLLNCRAIGVKCWQHNGGAMDDDDFDTVDELPAAPRVDIPPTDRELLELAARAIGATRTEEVDGEGYLNLHLADGTVVHAWNPLVHSDDAFNLMVTLNLWPARDQWSDGEYIIVVLSNGSIEAEIIAGDPIALTRRVLTRAAAEIGKTP